MHLARHGIDDRSVARRHPLHEAHGLPDGGDAERLYARLGWQRVGVIPDYALWPHGGLCATTVFYRRMA